MSVTIPKSHLDLLNQPIVITLTTVTAQGEPYSVVTWKRWDGEYLYLTSDAGKRKHRNILENRNVAILILDPKSDHRYLSLGGVVEEIIDIDVITELDRQSIAFTGAKYFGNLEPSENEATFTGVYFKIRPTRVVTLG